MDSKKKISIFILSILFILSQCHFWLRLAALYRCVFAPLAPKAFGVAR
jgi:hypothetical protein